MNKPDRPEIFGRAKGLFKQAADSGAKALKSVGDVSTRAWNKATEGDEKTHRRKTLLILGGGIFAVIAAIFIISRVTGDGATPVEGQSNAQAISVVAVQTATFTPSISLNGEARPVRDIQVAAPATGVRILQLMVDEGDYVRVGQPMARLDSNLATAQIRAAQAGVAEAQSASVRARGEYERAESIRTSGALSTEAIEARRSAAIAADARLAAARAQAQEVNARLGGGYVRAPAAGLVIDRTAEVGRPVDGQVLFRIAAGNDLEVAAQVAESDALALSEGTNAQFTLVDGSTVAATLRRLPASIDSRTRTGEALFQLPSGTRVRAGMYLRGHAVLPPREVLAVPQSSVLYEAGQPYVFVVANNPTPAPEAEGDRRRRDDDPAPEPTYAVSRVQVTLGLRDGDQVEITAGLQPGQRIVGAGAAFLRDGDDVRVLPQAHEQAPQAEGAAIVRQNEKAQSGNLRGRE